jgi:hypothetical protein
VIESTALLPIRELLGSRLGAETSCLTIFFIPFLQLLRASALIET